MSTRTTLRPTTVISGASMAANITSSPTILQSLTGVSYTVSWTGTSPVGTLAVQVCNDCTVETNGTVIGGTWTSLPLQQQPSGTVSQTIAISGNTGSGQIEIDTIKAHAIQLLYTAASGTGTLTAVVTGKVS